MPDLGLADLPGVALMVLGVGFLGANLALAADFVRCFRYRSRALVTWPGRRPAYYGLFLALGVVFAVLVVVKLVVQARPPEDAFGESMMLIYYGYLWPMSFRIGRGVYRHGIWAETGFVRDDEIGGLSWREAPELSLVVIAPGRQLARPLYVPQRDYAEVRRLLRDKIANEDIRFSGASLDLGGDARDVV